MDRKGQVEFIAVLVFVALALVVAYTSFFRPEANPALPDSVKRKANAIDDYFTGMASRTAADVAAGIEQAGGFEDPSKAPGGSAIYLGSAVPVWQRCSSGFAPTLEEMEQAIAKGIEDRIRRQGPEAAETFGDMAAFDFSKLSVSASVREDSIDVSISLPTEVMKYKMEGRYNISVPSSLGRIHAFASGFASSQGKERYFENFLLATIYLSEETSSFPLLPVFDVFSSNETIFRPAEAMSDGLAKSINYSITNILLWKPMEDAGSGSNPKHFSIADLSGKRYEDLNSAGPQGNITFRMADNLTVSVSKEFQWRCEGKFIEKTDCDRFSQADACLTSFNVDYPVTYPVVVSVADGPLRSTFRFAVLAALDSGMKPGAC